MNHWLFITAAYAVTLTGLGSVLAASWMSMRRAEANAAAILDPQ